MKQSTQSEHRGAQALYESGEMNVAEIARDTGRSQKTIHGWKTAEGWTHPDDQLVLNDTGLAPWPEEVLGMLDAILEAVQPENRVGPAQGAVSTLENPIDVPGPTEAAQQTSDPALRAEVEALQAKNDALRAALIESYTG